MTTNGRQNRGSWEKYNSSVRAFGAFINQVGRVLGAGFNVNRFDLAPDAGSPPIGS
ncbi:MAG: hypothetical protein JWL82_374 [Parcubacteria group bacterium]|nr:hypothetical protein [Parcubacteria group bacterium]